MSQTAAAVANEAPQGTIRDQGYQPYTGDYTPERGRWKLLYGRMLRMTARQAWVTAMLIIAVLPTLGAGVLLWINLKIYPQAVAQMQAQGITEIPPFPNFAFNLAVRPYGTLLVAALTALFAGSGAVADDLRGGAAQFYFARPVQRWQYGLGKVLVPVTLVAFVTLIPSVLMTAIRLALATDGGDAKANLLGPLQAIGLGVIIALTLALPAVALSSLSKSRGYAQGGYAALFGLPWIVGGIFAEVTRSPWPALLSIPAHLKSVGAFIFRIPEDPDERLFPWWISSIFVGVIIAGSLWVIRQRLKKMEVVSG